MEAPRLRRGICRVPGIHARRRLQPAPHELKGTYDGEGADAGQPVGAGGGLTQRVQPAAAAGAQGGPAAGERQGYRCMAEAHRGSAAALLRLAFPAAFTFSAPRPTRNASRHEPYSWSV